MLKMTPIKWGFTNFHKLSKMTRRGLLLKAKKKITAEGRRNGAETREQGEVPESRGRGAEGNKAPWGGEEGTTPERRRGLLLKAKGKSHRRRQTRRGRNQGTRGGPGKGGGKAQIQTRTIPVYHFKGVIFSTIESCRLEFYLALM